MGIIIDKENFMVVKTSYGYYTDNQGFMYPFSVEVNETAKGKLHIVNETVRG